MLGSKNIFFSKNLEDFLKIYKQNVANYVEGLGYRDLVATNLHDLVNEIIFRKYLILVPTIQEDKIKYAIEDAEVNVSNDIRYIGILQGQILIVDNIPSRFFN
jgi:hypothetical protein